MASENYPDNYEYSPDNYYYYYSYEESDLPIPDEECPAHLARELPTVRREEGMSYCNQTYDSVVCFPAIQVGSFVSVSCPSEVQGLPLNPEGTIHKYCFPNGTWDKADYMACIPESFADMLQPSATAGLPQTSTYEATSSTVDLGRNMLQPNISIVMYEKETQSNFLDLKMHTEPPLDDGLLKNTTDHFYYIALIENMGLVLSVIALLVALFIFYYCRRTQTLLQSIRNHIQMSLVTANILHLTLTLVLPKLLSMSLANPEAEAYPWTCQLIKFAYNYLNCTIYFWLLCEALYFFIIMVWDLNCDTGKLWKYQILGWGFPFMPVLIWGILQAVQANIGCVNSAHVYDYIFIAPVLLVLLMIIIFLVCTTYCVVSTPTTSANKQDTEYTSYKKSMRTTLIVFPVLVVIYVLHLLHITVPVEQNDVVYISFLYLLAVVHGLQGVFVAVVYCFLNREVWHALKNRPKKWRIRKSSKI